MQRRLTLMYARTQALQTPGHGIRDTIADEWKMKARQLA